MWYSGLLLIPVTEYAAGFYGLFLHFVSCVVCRQYFCVVDSHYNHWCVFS
jgi:hypothetical protein